MQPGTIASGTIKDVKHIMDAKHIYVRMVPLQPEPPMVNPSSNGSIATRIPQVVQKSVATLQENTMAAT